jgi:hypothetical protein
MMFFMGVVPPDFFMVGKLFCAVPGARKSWAGVSGAFVRSCPMIAVEPGQSNDAIGGNLPHCTSLFPWTLKPGSRLRQDLGFKETYFLKKNPHGHKVTAHDLNYQ